MRHVVVDIETVSHACAVDFIAKPDLDAFTPDLDAIGPAGNLKDPAKIAESIAKRRADAVRDANERAAGAMEAYEDHLKRAALDWNLSRIVALAWQSETSDTLTCHVCKDEDDEIEALIAFWNVVRQHQGIAGFAARTFDVPTLIQRSRLLCVPHPRVSLARFGNGTVLDLREILTFDDARYEAIMPRSLKAFCRRFGIPVDDAIDGQQIPDLVAAGDWDAVEAHITSDVRLTVALGRRVGYLAPQREAVTA